MGCLRWWQVQCRFHLNIPKDSEFAQKLFKTPSCYQVGETSPQSPNNSPLQLLWDATGSPLEVLGSRGGRFFLRNKPPQGIYECHVVINTGKIMIELISRWNFQQLLVSGGPLSRILPVWTVLGSRSSGLAWRTPEWTTRHVYPECVSWVSLVFVRSLSCKQRDHAQKVCLTPHWLSSSVRTMLWEVSLRPCEMVWEYNAICYFMRSLWLRGAFALQGRHKNSSSPADLEELLGTRNSWPMSLSLAESVKQNQNRKHLSA